MRTLSKPRIILLGTRSKAQGLRQTLSATQMLYVRQAETQTDTVERHGAESTLRNLTVAHVARKFLTFRLT
jgi:hypothetical protein